MDSLSGKCGELCIVTAVIFVAYLLMMRVLNDPLKAFPGPRLASLTPLYVAYYEIIKSGRLLEQLQRLHKQYGPIVRIGLNLLHFSDPAAHPEIYNKSSNLTKEPEFYNKFSRGRPSSFSLSDQREHKFRHDLISPFFSRRAIGELECVIQEKIDFLIERMGSYEGESVDMSLALRSATLDIITSYCFATDYSALTFPSFQHPLLLSIKAGSRNATFMQNFPILAALMLRLPRWVLLRVSPGTQAFINFMESVDKRVDSLLANPESLGNSKHETIYHHLMNPDSFKKGGRPLTREEMLAEAGTLLVAGSDTVGNACTVGMFHVLNNEDVHVRLRRELEDAWPDVEKGMKFDALKKLPYLTAVIKESLRLSHGAVSRLPRVVGPNPIQIMGIDMPVGTVVSMFPPFMHWHEGTFPDPHKFDPGRWLQSDTKQLDRHLVPFSRGSRICVGMNLAWCELYLIFANVFRKLTLKNDGTTVEDLAFRAYFFPEYPGRPFHARVGNLVH